MLHVAGGGAGMLHVAGGGAAGMLHVAEMLGEAGELVGVTGGEAATARHAARYDSSDVERGVLVQLHRVDQARREWT